MREKRGHDIEHSIFNFKFCLENLVSVINRASLYLPSSITCPDWYKNDYKTFLKYMNSQSDIDSLKPYFRIFYQKNKETIFDSFDTEKLDYKCFINQESPPPSADVLAVSVADPPVLETEIDVSPPSPITTEVFHVLEFEENEKLGKITLPLTSLSDELKKRFLSKGKKNTVPLRYHPLQFTFYFTYCVYNSLYDEDGGDELWDYLSVMADRLDEIFENKGPSSETALVSREPDMGPLRALLNGGGTGLPPQLQGIMSMISSLGFDLNGSEEALGSLNRIFEKMSSSIAVDPSKITTSDGGIDINQVCNNVSEVLADPSIQTEFNNILTNGKKIFDVNSGVVQDPAFQNNIKNIAETFLGGKK